MNDEIMSKEEAAKLIRVGMDCMDDLIATGRIYAASLNRKHCVLLREDVVELIRKSSREQTTQRRAAFAALKPADPEKPQRGRSRRRKPLPQLVNESH